jgi:metal-dependent hydrolase (beta-lactamase superfamily II)
VDRPRREIGAPLDANDVTGGEGGEGGDTINENHHHCVGGKVYLVMGGFHLGGTSQRRVKAVIADFRQLGVQRVAPCHCTGDRAIRVFAEEYGDDFIETGVGMVLDIGP